MFALNINKGSNVRHPHIGILEPLMAIEIEDEKVINEVKNIKDIIVFNGVVDRKIEKAKEKDESLMTGEKIYLDEGIL